MRLLVLLAAVVGAHSAKLRGSAPHSATLTQLQARVRAAARGTTKDDVFYLNEMLNKFSRFAAETNATVHARHQREAARLAYAANHTADPIAAVALQQSVTTNLESEAEASEVLTEMTKFIRTMQGVTAQASMPGNLACGDKNCGSHASCTRTTLGPECVCDEGYTGDGLSCAVPTLFMPQRLLLDGLHGRSSQVADINVAVQPQSQRLLVVFRDISHKVGRVMVGSYTSAHVEWGSPEQFTKGPAFDPVVVAVGGSLSVLFRDDDREATLLLVAGEVGVSGIRGADKHITWGQPLNLARNQAHRAVLLALGEDKVCAMYKDHRPATKDTAERHFATAALLQVGAHGTLSALGQYPLLEFAVTRLTALMLSPTTFVVGYRGAKHVDEMDSTLVRRQEASVIYGELVESELVFDPHPLDLEPETTNIWDRQLSLLAPNVFGYAYLTGLDQTTRLAVVRVDPSTHQMTVLSRNVVHHGFTPFVRMVDVPYADSDPHTMTFYEAGGENKANVCKVTTASGALSHCEAMTWLERKVNAVQAVRLGAGRVLFAFVDEDGIPYVQVVGLSKK